MPRMKKPAPPKAAGAKKSNAEWWSRPPAIGAAVVCAMGLAVVIAAYSSPSGNVTASTAMSNGASATKAGAEKPGSAARTTRAASVADTSIEPSNATAATASAPARQTPPPVTVTGCLARGDDAFELKDTSGEAAPKSRSWKSGFLKKSSPSIEVVDAANRLKLSNHVGERVTVTGTLVDRKMTAKSLQRVAPTCDGSPKVKA